MKSFLLKFESIVKIWMAVCQNFIIYWELNILLSFGNGKRIEISFFLQLHTLKQLQRLSSLASCDINTFKFRILWTLISPTDRYLLIISTISCSENLENISVYKQPQKWYVSSILVFQYLFQNFCMCVLYFLAIYFYFLCITTARILSFFCPSATCYISS